MSDFFITGCVRSGTTLLEKLLCNHPNLSVLSQPLPMLYIMFKKQFMNSIGIHNEYFSLSHYVAEERYTPQDFTRYIESSLITEQTLNHAFNTQYDGQLTPLKHSEIKPQSLINLYEKQCKKNAHNADANLFGSKEVLCEEFVPYYLNNGIKVLHILRDPRDVISSIKTGKGSKFIGAVKPTLFELRNWRKSAQLAIQCRDNPHFYTLHYEELVTDTENQLDKICDFLEIEPFLVNAFVNGILDQNQKQWKSNSSFGENSGIVSSKSVGKYKENLSTEMVQYILTICYPELSALNRDLSLVSKPIASTIESFVEPKPVNDVHFSPTYSNDRNEVEYEVARLKQFLDNNGAFEFNLAGCIANGQ